MITQKQYNAISDIAEALSVDISEANLLGGTYESKIQLACKLIVDTQAVWVPNAGNLNTRKNNAIYQLALALGVTVDTTGLSQAEIMLHSAKALYDHFQGDWNIKHSHYEWRTYEYLRLLSTVLYPPNWADVIQYTLNQPLYQDETTKNWFSPDVRGDQLRDVHEGGYLQMNGSDNYVDLGDISTVTRSTGKFYLEITCGYSALGTFQGCFDTETALLSGQFLLRKQNTDKMHCILRQSNGTQRAVTSAVTIGLNDILCIELWADGAFINISVNNETPVKASYDGTLGQDIVDAWIGTYNRGVFMDGSVYRVRWDDGFTGIYDLNLDFEEQSGITVYDKSGNGNNGTLNGTLTSIWQESLTIPSYRNLNGYNLTSGVYIPRLETAENIALPIVEQKDVLGNILEFNGRCEYPLQAIEHSIIQTNGTDNTLAFSDLTGITVVSSVGTATPTKNVNNIDWTAGTVEQLTLSNGSVYTFAEGDGAVSYDTVNSLHGTWQGTLTSLWQTSDTANPDNLINGFDLWDNDSTSAFLRVPFDANGDSIKTDGDTITGYTWVSRNTGSETKHNGAESKLQQPNAPQLYDVDQLFDTQIWYDGTPTAIPYEYNDIVTDYDSKGLWFNRIINAPFKDRHVVYDTPQEGWLTGEDYHNILNFLNALEFVYDSEGVLVTYEDGTPMTVVKEGVF